MTERRLVGRIQLPEQMYCAEELLGKSFDVVLKSARLRVTFPGIDKSRTTEMIELSDPTPNDTNVWQFGDRHGWGYCGFRRQADGTRHSYTSYVTAVGFEGAADVDEDTIPAELASKIGLQFDPWLALTYEWLELWSVLRLMPRDAPGLRSNGQLLDYSTDPPSQTGWAGPIGAVSLYPAEVGLTYAMMRAATERANANESPAPQWSLFSRAFRIGDTRQAVIEAATAAEVAMTRAIFSRFPESTNAAQELIVQGTNGLAGQIRLLEAHDKQTEPSLLHRVIGQLAGLRNDAVHRAVRPSAEDAHRAVQCARAVLDRYTPLEEPS